MSSINNLYSEGNKGGDFNYRLKVLQGLQQTITNSSVLNNLSAVERKPKLLRESVPGSIKVLCYDFSIANVGTRDGYILGVVIKPGEILNFSAGTLHNYYPANTIDYDGTGTELLITLNS